MTAIVCDICKKAVAGARREANYAVLLDKDICLDCQDELWSVTKQHMKARRPYTFKDYQATLVGNLSQMTR